MSASTTIKWAIFFILITAIAFSCQKDEAIKPDKAEKPDTSKSDQLAGTPLELDIPAYYPQVHMPADNPLTEEGVKLGRMLFYDPALSQDSSMSCATCHKQENAFASNVKFNRGVGGFKGVRNAMSLANVGFYPTFNWHGSVNTLEEQALEPVTNPIEMMASWPNVIKKLKNHHKYPERFKEAFGDEPITRDLVAKAIAQFERTLISDKSKFDRWLKGQTTLSESERNGLLLYTSERADCFHCHGTPRTQPLLTDNQFHNNGLDSMGPNEFAFEDKGLGAITGDQQDNGKFKTPTLRNITLTGPYMHDGRFETLKAVIDFYSDSLQPAPNVDPNIRKHLPPTAGGYFKSGGVNLTEQEKQDLISFLETFTDTSFVNNPQYSNPFQ